MPSAALRIQTSLAAAPVLMPERERKLAEMRALLSRTPTLSPSESLRLLRNAYPEAPLSLRVAAAGISG